MVRPRVPLYLVALSTVLVASAYASAFLGPIGDVVGPWLMASGSAGLVVSTMALGAIRPGRDSRRLVWVLCGVFAVVFGSFAAGLLLHPASTASARSLLGLPIPAALVVYGVGLLPLLVLPFAYARSFRESQVDPEAIRRRAAEIERNRANLPPP